MYTHEKEKFKYEMITGCKNCEMKNHFGSKIEGLINILSNL
jgi:hypothetical protein